MPSISIAISEDHEIREAHTVETYHFSHHPTIQSSMSAFELINDSRTGCGSTGAKVATYWSNGVDCDFSRTAVLRKRASKAFYSGFTSCIQGVIGNS
jgi:hypothetical protein